MLTCKSLFGLGYRGERLIEPFILRWLRVRPKVSASHFQLDCACWINGKTVKLRGHVVKPMIGLTEETQAEHLS